MCMYADDTTISFTTEDIPKVTLSKHITTEFDKVDVWLKHNKLSLNVEKTKCISFHTCRKKNETVTTLNRLKTYRTCKILWMSSYIIWCELNMEMPYEYGNQ